MLWFKDAEINKKLAKKFLEMSEKYCRLEEELLSREEDELKNVLFIFHFLFFLKENYLMSWILKAKEALFQVQL